MNISFGVSSVTYDNQNNFKIDNVTIPCNISSDDSTKLLCNYTYESIIKGRTLTLQLGDTSGALFQRKLYLVKYAVTNLPLIKENYNLNFLSAISTRPFDFYLDDYNIAIEYDGTQHYFPTAFFTRDEEAAKENFEYVKSHDKIKTKYCEDNGIKLIRIPYWSFNKIEEIIKSEVLGK